MAAHSPAVAPGSRTGGVFAERTLAAIAPWKASLGVHVSAVGNASRAIHAVDRLHALSKPLYI